MGKHMKRSLSNLIFKIATLAEGFALVIVLCGYLWILLLPSHITHHQQDTMIIAYKITDFALVVAWAMGFSSFFSFLFMKTRIARNSLTNLQWWMVLSFIVTIILTIAFVMTEKRISVIGPG